MSPHDKNGAADKQDARNGAGVQPPSPANGDGDETHATSKPWLLPLCLRALFILFLCWFSLKFYQLTNPPEPPADASVQAITQFHSELAKGRNLYAALAALFGGLVVWFEWRHQRRLAKELVALVFGLAAGLATSLVILLLLVTFYMSTAESVSAAFLSAQPWIPLLVLSCSYVGVTIVLQTRDDFRFLIPYVDFSERGTKEGGLVVDTSAIIDGRFAEICETRLISVPVIVPDFVVRELQTLADSADRMKRLRGRRGLDIVAAMQKSEAARVLVRTTAAPVPCVVDQELVKCAKELAARIVTTDFNLNKVSQIEGVAVVNVNDLANALKPAVVPGDRLTIKVLRAGQEPGQGVGYLDDGTMVVIEGGRDHVGYLLATTVTGSIQTSAGRMIFVKPE
jgi:uncharacterized protein YacL